MKLLVDVLLLLCVALAGAKSPVRNEMRGEEEIFMNTVTKIQKKANYRK